LGANLMLLAHKKGLTSDLFEGVAALSLAAMAFLFAGEIGGNGFIAAFIGGLTFGNIVKGRCRFLFEFTESEGQLLMWGAFFLLGLALLPEAIAHLTPTILGLILVSLFLVRPAAIWISLIGSGATPATKLFFGWFGPRGLATALFALLIVPQIGHPYAEPILAIAINAVWISALLHGVSAMPAGNFYAQLVARKGPCKETEPIMVPFEDTLRRMKPKASAGNKTGVE
jgi:NhaP-type Na+/H+ or K+/H+ antiporter